MKISEYILKIRIKILGASKTGSGNNVISIFIKLKLILFCYFLIMVRTNLLYVKTKHQGIKVNILFQFLCLKAYKFLRFISCQSHRCRKTAEILFNPLLLATVVKGDQKAPFSIVTTPRCRGGLYSFPWIAPLYPWYVPYIAEC